MGRRILVIALLLLLAAFAYYGYSSYDGKRAGDMGEVFSRDGSKVHGAGGTTNEDARPSGSMMTAYPSAVRHKEPENPAIAPTEAERTPVLPSSGGTATGTVPPATDSISPNPTNGMIFSGTGKYQLYRQGNLTWRLDTNTGESCILFATDAEWRKPRVFQAGCAGK